MDISFYNIIKDKPDTIIKSAGVSLSIAIIAVPYIHFNLPGSEYVPAEWFGIMNLWLLIGGVIMIITLIKEKYRKVTAKCPECKNASLKEVANPKWECTICGWKQT